jgi:hypothetical protein
VGGGAWLTTNRRLAMNYERAVETGEMLLYLAMNRILLRRLTRQERYLLTSIFARSAIGERRLSGRTAMYAQFKRRFP